LESLDGAVGFVLLDGWKELYLPVIRLLQPRLSAGTLIVADNTENGGRTVLSRLCSRHNGYVSVIFLACDSDSMEITCRS
jgi:predicted O-methyltransferase YrrM